MGNFMMKEFKDEIFKCKEFCLKELTNRKNGVYGESTLEQLECVIIPEINEIIKMISLNQLPPKEKRYLISFANAFTVWGWDMQNPSQLFLQLTQLNNNYKNYDCKVIEE